MKVSVSQSALAQALNTVSHAVSSRSTMVILENVLLSTTEDGTLCVAGTNLEMAIQYWVPAQIEDQGAISVPARLFTDLINALADGMVFLNLDEKTQTLFIRCQQFSSEIKGIDSIDFPPLPVFDESQAVKFEFPDLRKMIQQVSFAASTDETRPVFMGVYMNVSGNTMAMAATDGFRIAVKKNILKTSFEKPINAIIPAKALNELAKITSESEKDVMMALSTSDGQVIFKLSNIEIASQLIAGDFVDYEAIIPKTFQTTTTVSNSAMKKACSAALIIARDSKYLARLDIQAGDGTNGKIEITAKSEQADSQENNVAATIAGPDIKIAFNVRYLLDGLEAIESPNAALQTNTSVSPGMLIPMDDKIDYKYVIMPMHFGE